MTTLNPDGSVNCGAMGVEWGAQRIVIKPYRGTRTLRNLRATGAAVVNLTDDMLLFSQAALGDPHPPTRPAASVEGAVLGDACSWREVRVEAIDERAQRARVSTVVVDGGTGREFLGLNRARHAVLEASILASRVRMLDAGGHPRRAAPAAGARGQDGRAARARGDGVRPAPSSGGGRRLMRRVRVEAPARLHLGMLAVAGDGARRFGGLGVSVGRPAVVLEAEPADELSAEGADAERALTFARRCRDALGLAGGAHLRVVEAIPQHVGLGSGTKLALAVAQALATLEGRDVDAPGLAEAAGRAARSAVGMWTFALGGLVVEGGHRPRRRAPGAAAGASPDARRSGGRCSSCPRPRPACRAPPRKHAFGRLVPAPERSAVIAQLVLTVAAAGARRSASSRSSAPR